LAGTGDVVLVVLALAGQTNSATTLDLFLPNSGDRQAVPQGHGEATAWAGYTMRTTTTTTTTYGETRTAALYNILSGIQTSTSIRRRGAISGRSLPERTDFGPAGAN